MILAHISDTHITSHGKKTYGIAPMAENLELCIHDINTRQPTPDVVLITGDLTADGQEDEASCAAALLTKLTMPFFIVPGNHDNRTTLWNIFKKTGTPSPNSDFIHYCINSFPLRLIGVDSLSEGQPGGELCPYRLQWLRETLNTDIHKPTLLFMHHPPAPCGVWESDIDGFQGAQELHSIVQDYPTIQGILCGHIHLSVHRRYSSTLISTAPSTGMELDADFTLQKDSKFKIIDPSYALHIWTAENVLLSHTINIHRNSTSYEFSYHQST